MLTRLSASNQFNSKFFYENCITEGGSSGEYYSMLMRPFYYKLKLDETATHTTPNDKVLIFKSPASTTNIKVNIFIFLESFFLNLEEVHSMKTVHKNIRLDNVIVTDPNLAESIFITNFKFA